MQLDDSPLSEDFYRLKSNMVYLQMISNAKNHHSSGLNHRFSAGWHAEDFVGRLVDSPCVSQNRALEESGLVQWYVGFLGIYSPVEFMNIIYRYI